MTLNEIPVATLLGEKKNSVHCTSANSTVYSAVLEMNRLRIGSVLVRDADHLVGIFTERDVLTRVVAAGLDPKSTLMYTVMTSKVQFISWEESVEDAMQIMLEQHIRHLPVFERNQLVGMISIGDITSWLSKMNEFEAESLRRYIFEGYPS